MAANARSPRRQVWELFASVRTGILLLITTGLAVLAGTLILQRPITEPGKMHEAYSPDVLQWLDRLRLTDVFHSWWFITLLCFLAANIVVVSIDRFPAAWRYYSRPYRRAEAHFLRSLRAQREIPVRNSASAIERVELAFRRMGLKPQYVSDDRGNISLYAEKNRIGRMAPFIVHASLLLILAGGIIDAVWGYKGFVSLTKNESARDIELSDGRHKPLGFALRCDGAGQENYSDGSPKRWWSKLTVIENGREVLRKEIAVNDPLTYRGIRFYQASYGPTSEVSGIRLAATPKDNVGRIHEFVATEQAPTQVDADTTVQVAQFVPDFVIVDNQIQKRSEEPNNPAIQLAVDSRKDGTSKLWVFPNYPEFSHGDSSRYKFSVLGVEQGYFTGLAVSHEPGQWTVWAGVILMGLSLVLVFYFVHVRYWAVVVEDGSGGSKLWIGAHASKNREEVEERFRRVADIIQADLRNQSAAERKRLEPATAGGVK